MRDSSYKPPGSRILTIPIEPELHQALRILAAQRNLTMKALGIEALEAILKSAEREPSDVR